MQITQIDNLPNEVYHNSKEYFDYWSSSNVKGYLETPREAHFQKFVKEQGKRSDAFIFGEQIHDMLASRHVNGQPFEYNIFEPPVNPSTGKYYGKETKAYLAELNQIQNPISSDTMQVLGDIWDMIKCSDYAWYIFEKILKKGIAEPSFFVNGLHKYKYRPDVLTDKEIFDWKSVSKKYWNEKSLKNRVIDLGYDISAAMYQYFEHQRTGIWKPFVVIWIMKDPPYDVLVDDISKFAYQPIGDNEVVAYNGAVTFKKIKDLHEACQAANQWPGIANQYAKINGVRMAQYIPSPFRERDFPDIDIDIDIDKF